MSGDNKSDAMPPAISEIASPWKIGSNRITAEPTMTAAAVVVGAFVILFDPIFQGLAISLMMGEVAATLLSRMAVPVVYYLIARGGRAEQLRQEGLAPELSA